MMDKQEEWKDVVGYEGLYEVSNLGRVRSLDRETKDTIGRKRKYKGQLLNPTISNNGNGYLRVRLSEDGKRTDFRVHRLVAEAFIPNPDNKTDVGFKELDKSNVSVENLYWTTHSEAGRKGQEGKDLQLELEEEEN